MDQRKIIRGTCQNPVKSALLINSQLGNKMSKKVFTARTLVYVPIFLSDFCTMERQYFNFAQTDRMNMQVIHTVISSQKHHTSSLDYLLSALVLSLFSII